MCEASKAAILDVKTQIMNQQLSLITEEDERTSSRNSLDKEYSDRLKKQLKDPETSSIVESEDGVSKIKIGASSEEIFKQVIEVKDDAEEHRKISASLEPVLTGAEEMGRN